VADEVGRFLTHLHTLRPDAVLLYENWTDLAFLASDKPLEQQAEEARRPYEIYSLLEPFYGSALIRALSEAFIRIRFGLDVHQGNLSATRAIGSPVSFIPADHAAPLALRGFELALEAFIAAVKSAGAKPILMPELTLLTATSPREELRRIRVSDAFSEPGRIETLAKLRSLQQLVANRSGALLVDLNDSLSGRSELFLDHVHLSAAGARAVAVAAARRLGPALCH
jgi:hypothetical protein